MHAQVYDSVHDALDQTFANIERNEKILIDSEVRLFISRFVFESLFYRREEWLEAVSKTCPIR